MDTFKYRRWYLSENWSTNAFHTVTHMVGIHQNHPRVLSGEAFWIDDSSLCIGYELRSDPRVFRPIFSHRRQRLLSKVHVGIIHPIVFWNRLRNKYYLCMAKLKQLPLECVEYIVRFIY